MSVYLITDVNIKMDVQDTSDIKTKLHEQVELVDKIFTHLLKPQVLSNIVNNVFNPLGCILLKFNTTSAPGALEFSIGCGKFNALVKIQESVMDGTLAKQMEKVILTVEVIGEEKLTSVSIKTHIDKETYREAREKLLKSSKIKLTFDR